MAILFVLGKRERRNRKAHPRTIPGSSACGLTRRCTLSAIIFVLPGLVQSYAPRAVAIHLRVADTARAAIPLVVGILAWGGLYLRDSRIRQLVPFRRSA